MEWFSVWSVWAVAQDIGGVASISDGTTGAKLRPILVLAHDAALWIEAEGNAQYLSGCRPACYSFRQKLRTVVDAIDEAEAGPDGWTLSLNDASLLRNAVQDLNTVLRNEAPRLHTYIASQVLGYDSNTLLYHGDQLLSSGARVKVPEKAIEDLREATKCLASGVYTASGFHTVRATESVIRMYLSKLSGKAPAEKDRNWGSYIRKLRSCAHPDSKVIGVLDHIRESYRNPVLHPRGSTGPR